ncbi:MAG: GHMP kinase [Planctomycetota bacterium]
MIIETHAYARAGLVGNPSDGYFGKTISFAIRDYKATVKLWDSPHFEIVPGSGDLCRYDSVDDFLRESKLMGYYGAMRLIKATVARFHDYAREAGHHLGGRSNFTISFDTDIPRLVGMSGSSGIVVATLRALMQFYDVDIPKEQLPTLALSVETKELGIAAGLQDRVVQTYEGIVYMDFDREMVERTGRGHYEVLEPETMPQVFVAFDPERAEVSDVPHRNLRKDWEEGQPDVLNAMKRLAELTDAGRRAILDFDMPKLHEVTNENYEVRKTIMKIAPENDKMVQVARSVGASAKFAGSGGAITGVYVDGDQYSRLVDALAEIRCTCFRPVIRERRQKPR